MFDGRQGISKPYVVRHPYLGTFRTAEEAALARARAVGGGAAEASASDSHDSGETLSGLQKGDRVSVEFGVPGTNAPKWFDGVVKDLEEELDGVFINIKYSDGTTGRHPQGEKLKWRLVSRLSELQKGDRVSVEFEEGGGLVWYDGEVQDREEELGSSGPLHFINILYSDGKTVRHQQDENLNLRLLSRAAAPAADDDDDDDGARRTRLSRSPPDAAAAKRPREEEGSTWACDACTLVNDDLTSQGQRRAKCAACNKVRPGISIKRPSEAEQLQSSNYNMLRADDPSPVLKRDRDDSDEERRTRSKS